MEAAAHGCAVSYDADARCVVMTWTDYRPGAAFRAANEAVLAALVEHRAQRILGDIEAVRITDPADQRWLAQEWLPRAAAAGLRRAALVTPAFELDHAAVRLVGEQIPPAIELEYFDDVAAARAWLDAR